MARPAPLGRTSTGEQEIQAVALLAGFRAMPTPPPVGPAGLGNDAAAAPVSYPVLPPRASRAPLAACAPPTTQNANMAQSSSPPDRFGFLLKHHDDESHDGRGGADLAREGRPRAAAPEETGAASPPPAKKARRSVELKPQATAASKLGGAMVKLEPGVDLEAIEAARVLTGADISKIAKTRRPRTSEASSAAKAAASKGVLRHSHGSALEADVDARLKRAASLVQSATSATAQERATSAWVQEWIGASYEVHPTETVSRTCLFARYCEGCAQYGLRASNAASFGKAMKTKFGTDVATRRLGVRGSSRYHYIGLRPTHEGEAGRLGGEDVVGW